jgi:hypothetical protein
MWMDCTSFHPQRLPEKDSDGPGEPLELRAEREVPDGQEAAAVYAGGTEVRLMKLPCCLIGFLALAPCGAAAHVFAQPYTLPVPFAIYAWAATVALLLSFAIVGVFAAAPALGRLPSPRRATADGGTRSLFALQAARACALGLLVLCILTGLVGSQNAFVNFNMTFFWIGFVLGVPYAVAVVGDFYAPINPWKTLTLLLREATGVSFDGRVAYPSWLGYAPGLALYMVFIWLELFGQLLPFGLAAALGLYTVVNVMGAWVFGIPAWFRHGEFFGIFLLRTRPDTPRAPGGEPLSSACSTSRPAT